MKKELSILMSVIFVPLLAGNSGITPLVPVQKARVAFTENRGQVHDQQQLPRTDVLFATQNKQLTVHFLRNGMSYQMQKVERGPASGIAGKNSKIKIRKITSVTTQRIDLAWLNTLPGLTVNGENAYPGVANYYTGNASALDVHSYEGIWYRGIYKGTDLHYYEKEGSLKYDFLVAPEADYKDISLQVKGCSKIEVLSNGKLLLHTPMGIVEEGAPIVFEQGRKLAANWVVNDNVLSFNIIGHRPGQAMVIDPTTRLWGTFYGDGTDQLFIMGSSDISNNAIAVGVSEAVTGTIVATSGAYQSTFGGGNYDGLIVKFNSSGVRQWATYYGGAGDEILAGSATGPNGDIAVCGNTDGLSGNTLSTPGSFLSLAPGGGNDVFVAKFSAAGVRIWGSYYGDSGDDGTASCSMDASGNVFLCGYTDAPTGTLIASTGAQQVTAGGSYDGFAAKFNSSGQRLWGTYFGGSGDDNIVYCSADLSGNLFISGGTDSPNGIATPGSYQTSINGSTDAIAGKYNGSGVLQWATYYGGSGDEMSYMCGADASGNLILGMDCDSPNGVSTTGIHQSTYGGGSSDALLVKLSSTGTLVWSTYYGGGAYDDFYGLSVDVLGNIYMTGTSNTMSGTSIATGGAWQNTNNGYDPYLVKFTPAGIRMWGTFFGTSGDETMYAAAMPNSDVYLIGYSDTGGSNIASTGSHQDVHGGSYDGVVARFSSCVAPAAPQNISPAVALNACSNKYNTLTASGSGTISWYNAATSGSLLGTGTTFSIGNTAAGVYTLYLESQECSNSASRTAVVYTVNAAPALSVNIPRNSMCEKESQNISVTGASTYSWSTAATSSAIVISPTTTSQYSVNGTTGPCSSSKSFTITVDKCTGLSSQASRSSSSLFPNPNAGQFELLINSAAEVQILNALGQQVHHCVLNTGRNAIVLDVPAGIYFAHINQGDHSEVIRFVKE